MEPQHGAEERAEATVARPPAPSPAATSAGGDEQERTTITLNGVPFEVVLSSKTSDSRGGEFRQEWRATLRVLPTSGGGDQLDVSASGYSVSSERYDRDGSFLSAAFRGQTIQLASKASYEKYSKMPGGGPGNETEESADGRATFAAALAALGYECSADRVASLIDTLDAIAKYSLDAILRELPPDAVVKSKASST